MPDTGRHCLLVEDQIANRDALASALRHAFDDIVLHFAKTIKEAEAWLEAGGSGSLWLGVIDLGLPDGSGTQLIRRLRREAPDAILVVATIYDDDQHLFDALAAGVQGYLLKDLDIETMAGFLRRVEHGEPPLSPPIARRLLRHFTLPVSVATAAPDSVALTGRETETLTLLARGLTINEVARALDLKPQTVAGYVKVIYQKLDISTRAEATLQAVKRGLA